MKDSNQFHAVTLDTFPPAFYMNDVSREIIDVVHLYNAACGFTKVLHLLTVHFVFTCQVLQRSLARKFNVILNTQKNIQICKTMVKSNFPYK